MLDLVFVQRDFDAVIGMSLFTLLSDGVQHIFLSIGTANSLALGFACKSGQNLDVGYNFHKVSFNSIIFHKIGRK